MQELQNSFSHLRYDNTTCKFAERCTSRCKIPYTITMQEKNKDKLQFKQKNIFCAVHLHYTKSVFLQKQHGH